MCDPALSHWITQRIGDGWTRDPEELEKLLPFAEDADSLNALLEVKQHNKRKLQALLRQRQGVEVDENSSLTSRSSVCTSTNASR